MKVRSHWNGLYIWLRGAVRLLRSRCMRSRGVMSRLAISSGSLVRSCWLLRIVRLMGSFRGRLALILGIISRVSMRIVTIWFKSRT
jgi:hypothetical protein